MEKKQQKEPNMGGDESTKMVKEILEITKKKRRMMVMGCGIGNWILVNHTFQQHFYYQTKLYKLSLLIHS